MDQALDFSFHKGNSLVVSDDEPESPKPMPKSPEFCHPTAEIDVDLFPELNEPDSFSSVAVEVIESLRISPARPSNKEEETVCAPSTSSATENLCSLPAVNSSNGSSTCVSRLSDHTQPSSPKPKAITKVPVERGFTQVDWLKLTRTQTDLAGLNGATNRRFITKAEVELHQSETDAWTILRGRVYNITHYLKFHPGGVEMLMQAAGQDCTSLFNQYHSWVNAEYILEKCLVGFLDFGN